MTTPTTAPVPAQSELQLIRHFADTINERNYADKRLYLLQHIDRLLASPSREPDSGAAIEPDMFWDDDNPDDSYRDVEDIFDATGNDHLMMIKVRCARALPDQWVVGRYDENDGWQCKFFDTEAEARAALQSEGKAR